MNNDWPKLRQQLWRTYATLDRILHQNQGHIPMKLLDFHETVNVSLGLPILRTSVGHGTAFDIAGQHKANAENMKAGMRRAVTLAQNRGGTWVN